MDIERAVEDFVNTGKDLFRRLRSEGESLSDLGLGILRTQLHVLTIEATRLQFKQPAASLVQGMACAHGRAIDNYVDENGNPTKLFYCLECGSVIEAPPLASEI